MNAANETAKRYHADRPTSTMGLPDGSGCVRLTTLKSNRLPSRDSPCRRAKGPSPASTSSAISATRRRNSVRSARPICFQLMSGSSFVGAIYLCCEILMAPALVRRQALHEAPGRESILSPHQHGSKLREVPQQDRHHVVVVYPIHPRLGVYRGREVSGKVAVASEAA